MMEKKCWTKGWILDANVGSVLLAEGEWKVDSKYGRQFVAEKWEETLPATVYGMEKYLGSGLIKGVGPKFAKKIVQKYGVDTFVVIEDNIELLIEIDGIGKKRIEMIAESWARQKEIKNIMLFLQEHQVSASYAAKIFKQYTGITRAKKILVIVGTRKALTYAVKNVTVTKRNTLLKERLGTES